MPKDLILMIPAAGLRVVDPADGQPLPPEGKYVEHGTHWIRRVNEGDASEATPEQVKAFEDAEAAAAAKAASDAKAASKATSKKD